MCHMQGGMYFCLNRDTFGMKVGSVRHYGTITGQENPGLTRACL